MYSISITTNLIFSKIYLNSTTLGCRNVHIILDSFLSIFSALPDNFSLLMILRADFSPDILFLTSRTTPKAPYPSKSLTLKTSLNYFSDCLFSLVCLIGELVPLSMASPWPPSGSSSTSIGQRSKFYSGSPSGSISLHCESNSSSPG